MATENKQGFFARLADKLRESAEKAKENEEQRKAAAALEKQQQKEVTAYSETSDREYTLKPYFAECTCRDWQKKRSDAYGPFALCKHLVRHYMMHPDDAREDIQPFQSMLLDFAIADKGMPYMGEVHDYGDIEGMAYIFTGFADRLPWVNVYTQSTGEERLGYNFQTQRWAKDRQPSYAKELEILIEKAQ